MSPSLPKLAAPARLEKCPPGCEAILRGFQVERGFDGSSAFELGERNSLVLMDEAMYCVRAMALGHLTAALVSRRHPRVLLVDDDDAGSLQQLLASLRPRWVFSNVHEGSSVLCEMHHWPPDVVVTALDRVSGFELLRAMAEAFPATVRFVYSDRLDELADHPELDLAHLVLRRPAETEALIEALELSLELSQQLQCHDAGTSLASH